MLVWVGNLVLSSQVPFPPHTLYCLGLLLRDEHSLKGTPYSLCCTLGTSFGHAGTSGSQDRGPGLRGLVEDGVCAVLLEEVLLKRWRKSYD